MLIGDEGDGSILGEDGNDEGLVSAVGEDVLYHGDGRTSPERRSGKFSSGIRNTLT